jgi:hypothetical protein
MRLIASPAYRAFPELDAFSDAQCREFAARAAGSRARRVTRVVARLVASVVAVPVGSWACYVAVAVGAGMRMSQSMVLFASILLAGLLAGGATWLLSGDLSLRLAIRRVMRIRGTCHGCGYVLVGLPVGASFEVLCPECGECTSLARDRVHCVLDAAGQLRFLPSADVQVAPVGYWTRRRTKAWLRRLARGGGAVVGILAIAITAHEVRNRWNASVAASRRAQIAPAERWIERFAPPSARDPGPNALELLAGFGAQVNALRDEPFAEFIVRMGSIDQNPGGEDSVAEWERCRRAVMLARSKGLLEFADAVVDCTRTDPRRPEQPRPGRMVLSDAWLDAVTVDCQVGIFNLRQLSLARARTGAAQGDDAEVLRGAKGLLASVRLRHAVVPPIMWTRPSGVLGTSRDVIRAIRRSGGEQAAADLAAEVRRASWTPDVGLVVDFVVEDARSSICALYSSLDAARWGVLSDDSLVSQYFKRQRGLLPHQWVLPSFDAAWDAAGSQHADALRAALAKPSSGVMVVPASLVDVYVFVGSMNVANEPSRWHAVLELRAFETMLAIERFRLARGRLPASLDALVPEFLERLPNDPWRDGPLAYELVDDGPDGVGYALRSAFTPGASGSPSEPSDASGGMVVVPAPSCAEPPAASPGN